MSETFDRRIQLATAPNLRSLGGLPVRDGEVIHDSLFRSATLGALSAADGESLVELGVRRVFDFRTDGERRSAPDQLPQGVEHVSLDVLGEHAGDLAASLGHIGVPGQKHGKTRPPAQVAAMISGVNEALGNGRGAAMLRDSYTKIVSSESALRAYRDFYFSLADGSGTDITPSLFHCTTGKDRTGWAAASLLLLLGADDDTVMADYLQTNTDILPMITPMLAQAEGAGIDPELLRPVLTVDPSFLDAALVEMTTRFGSVEGYFIEGLGLGEEHLRSLRSRYVSKG